MTDETETTFQDRVIADLKGMYGAARVQENKVLEVTGREVDIYVETPDGADNLAIEIENDWEACFKGHGQVSLYAHQLDCRPIILVPPGHIEFPEAFYLSTMGVGIFQWHPGS